MFDFLGRAVDYIGEKFDHYIGDKFDELAEQFWTAVINWFNANFIRIRKKQKKFKRIRYFISWETDLCKALSDQQWNYFSYKLALGIFLAIFGLVFGALLMMTDAEQHDEWDHYKNYDTYESLHKMFIEHDMIYYRNARITPHKHAIEDYLIDLRDEDRDFKDGWTLNPFRRPYRWMYFREDWNDPHDSQCHKILKRRKKQHFTYYAIQNLIPWELLMETNTFLFNHRKNFKKLTRLQSFLFWSKLFLMFLLIFFIMTSAAIIYSVVVFKRFFIPFLIVFKNAIKDRRIFKNRKKQLKTTMKLEKKIFNKIIVLNWYKKFINPYMALARKSIEKGELRKKFSKKKILLNKEHKEEVEKIDLEYYKEILPVKHEQFAFAEEDMGKATFLSPHFYKRMPKTLPAEGETRKSRLYYAEDINERRLQLVEMLIEEREIRDEKEKEASRIHFQRLKVLNDEFKMNSKQMNQQFSLLTDEEKLNFNFIIEDMLEKKLLKLQFKQIKQEYKKELHRARVWRWDKLGNHFSKAKLKTRQLYTKLNKFLIDYKVYEDDLISNIKYNYKFVLINTYIRFKVGFFYRTRKIRKFFKKHSVLDIILLILLILMVICLTIYKLNNNIISMAEAYYENLLYVHKKFMVNYNQIVNKYDFWAKHFNKFRDYYVDHFPEFIKRVLNHEFNMSNHINKIKIFLINISNYYLNLFGVYLFIKTIKYSFFEYGGEHLITFIKSLYSLFRYIFNYIGGDAALSWIKETIKHYYDVFCTKVRDFIFKPRGISRTNNK